MTRPTASLQVREAAVGDEDAVVDLWFACGLVAAHNNPRADFRFARDRAGSEVLIGVDADKQVIGSVMVGHDGHRGWLYYVACAPGARGQGVGRAMVQAGERWLTGRGVRKVHLMVRETNTAVVSFYERLGYEDMPRVLMSKWLKSE